MQHRCRLLKNTVRLIPAENKRIQLCLQTELAEEISQSRGEHNKSTSRKKKVVTPNVTKKFCMQARNI